MSDQPKRGEGADWQDPWPVRGIAQGHAAPSPALDAVRAEGFRTAFDVTPIPEDADEYQDHLNNTAAVRIFNDVRIAYVATHLAPDWPRYMRREGRAVVVRELHVRYDSEGWMQERYVCAMRYAQRRGKGAIIEQCLFEQATARSVARGWMVHLFVQGGGAIDWPDWFWEMVAKAEGGPVPSIDGAPRAPWGPPQ